MKFINPIPDHQTEKRPSYRSEAERSIADMLDSYGIPFYYKLPTLVVEKGRKCIEYVDFSCRRMPDCLPTTSPIRVDMRTSERLASTLRTRYRRHS